MAFVEHGYGYKKSADCVTSSEQDLAIIAAAKLLIVDELGTVPLSPTGAELLFEVLSQHYERGSTIVTSHLPFEDRPALNRSCQYCAGGSLVANRREV